MIIDYLKTHNSIFWDVCLLNEARLQFGRRHAARVSFAPPFVSVFGDDVVAPMSDKRRDDHEYVEKWVEPIELAGNAQGCTAFPIHLVAT